ncbi:MAG: cytochrome P450 [Acidimicrobiales bacterium mtb01]|nr:cytochrome P450 [Actinomycetota bacterium]TEX46449.1 MAG: cytochrome P450 [Acidimicrobiales bacterium mtb01]
MTGYDAPKSIYGPVSDWTTDFDHGDPEYNRHAHAIWAELRDKCPVAHSDRYGGTWLPVTHEHVREIAYDTENFTSRAVVVSTEVPLDPAPIGGAPPITSDPPFHHEARRIVLPPFSPKKIAEWEPEIRRMCNELLDTMEAEAKNGLTIDAAIQYAQHIPVNVIARMLGFPLEDQDLFREFVHDILENINLDPQDRIAAFERIDAYLKAQIDDHIANPRDDLTGYLLDVELFGEKIPHELVGGFILLLLVAGIDTTWSAIGSSLWHLATHADDRRRLVNDPSLMNTAIEEFLRAYAPVTMARLVAKDHDFHGCPMKKDEWVLLPFPAANLDPAEFPDADKVLIDRAENRHAAFGLGIHRCLGSNLARLELRVAVEEFIKRFPDFELAHGEEGVVWSVGQIRGPRQLPVRVA